MKNVIYVNFMRREAITKKIYTASYIPWAQKHDVFKYNFMPF